MTTIQNKAIQYLIDEHTGYGQTERDRVVLDPLTEDDAGKHLFARKTVAIFIQEYIDLMYQQRHGKMPATGAERNTIVEKTGSGLQTAYNKKDIMSMIHDPVNKDRFERMLLNKTTLYNGERMPKVVAKYYREQEKGVVAFPQQKLVERRNQLRKTPTHKLLLSMQLIIEELTRRESETMPDIT